MMSSLNNLILVSLLVAALLNDGVQASRIAEQNCRKYIKEAALIRTAIALTFDAAVGSFKTENCSVSEDFRGNGVRAGLGEFPHQALLGYSINGTEQYEFRCGGSLISKRFVLTAAHCGTPQVVRLGELSLIEEDAEQLDFEVERFYKHPNYTLAASYHDIALVKMIDVVISSEIIRPACLWTKNVLNLSSVIATGFGHTEFAGTGSNFLLKVQLILMPKESCQESFEFDRRFKRGVLDEQLCVGSEHSGIDTCQGDSGGPIQILSDTRRCIYHIVGVTSLGTACGSGKFGNIYTGVASYLDWIEEIVWPGEG